MKTKSLTIAKNFLGKIVTVIIDRPLGSFHPKWNFEYLVNYGFIDGVMAPDGEELDAYVLKVNKAVDKFTGRVIAIIHRIDNDDDKLVVVPDLEHIDNKEIEKMIEFQEKWFKHEIIRK